MYSVRSQISTKSQPRTGHTREPDPTHNELKLTSTQPRRKTSNTHDALPTTPDKPHVHTHTHASRSENDANQQTTTLRITATPFVT